MDNQKPLLLEFAEEVQYYAKTLEELQTMLHGAVAVAKDMRLEIPVQVLRDVHAGKYHFTIMNKQDGIVLMAEKESVIEVAK